MRPWKNFKSYLQIEQAQTQCQCERLFRLTQILIETSSSLESQSKEVPSILFPYEIILKPHTRFQSWITLTRMGSVSSRFSFSDLLWVLYESMLPWQYHWSSWMINDLKGVYREECGGSFLVRFRMFLFQI